MTRIAALFDIHGNLPALEAVLGEVARERVDGIVIGGDIVPGPMPREVLGVLESLPMPVSAICGNGESDVLNARAGRELTRVPEMYRPLIHWTAAQLDEADVSWITSWGLTLRQPVEGLGDVLFCHATPRDNNEIFTRLTPEELLRPLFDGLGVSLVVCGHTHMPFDRTIGSTRVINAGSVGMPFGEPGADWLLLGPDVEPRHTRYDLSAAAARVRATGYPHAREFADTNILSPPTEASMLEIFTAAGLR